jgi:hypothetical protein
MTLPKPMMDRRSWILGSITAGLVFGNVHNRSFATTKKPSSMFRVRTVVKLNGEIRLKSQINDAKTNKGTAITAKTAPIQASTLVDVEEHIQIGMSLAECKSYVHVLEAESEVQVDRTITKTKLRESCRDIVKMGNDREMMTACLDNPLFASERELIDIPINSMFLDSLLTKKEVRVNDSWKVDNDSTCYLLGVEAVLDGGLSVYLVKNDDKSAQLEVKGTVAASVQNVATTITVDGKAQVDLGSGCVTWFAANVEETRDISERSPGFKVMAQVQMRRARIEEISSGLTLQSIASRTPTIEAASLQQFQSDLGFFRFLASRKWMTYRDSGEEATYRYIVDNHRVAQCNVTNMIDYESGRQLSMDGFVADVKTSLGTSLVEILESSERVTSSGMRALRVASRGSAQGVDIVWIHHHISNDDGRRAIAVFMLNADQLQEFAAEDAQIISTFELINWPTKLDSKSVEAASATTTPESKPEGAAVSTSKSDATRPRLSR